MENDTVVPDDAVRKEPFILFRIAQWAGFAVSLLVLAISFMPLDQLDTPGVDWRWFIASIGLSAVAAATLLPRVFWRLPLRFKGGAYALLVTAFLAVTTVFSNSLDAYKLTPEGKVWARAQARERAQQAAIDAEIARQDAAVRQAEAIVAREEGRREASAEYDSKLEDCFSTFGHGIPELTTRVKESLHNPDSFEHITTEVIPGSIDRNYNVVMQFRAENGFGAIRTATVEAKIDPEDCSIKDVGEYVT